MCMKLRELNGLTADELLEKVGQADVIPVDVAQICYDLGIRLQSFNFSEIEKQLGDEIAQKGEILGAVVSRGDDLAILYRESDSTNRKRFTIAHELAHSCLHIPVNTPQPYFEFRNDSISKDKKEFDANSFAGQLLVPEKSLRKLIGSSSFITSNSIKSLSKIFIVSENVMNARLKELNIREI